MKKLVSTIVFAVMLIFASDSYAEGMPEDIFAKVKESIESRYPDNYSMQKTLIEDQEQSYEFLQSYEPSSVPSNILDKIKNNISSRYPYNFSMQKTLIQDQVKSYLDLNK